MRKRLAVAAVCALGAGLALAVGGSAVSGQQPPCDFVTGGGYIYLQGTSNKANFAIGGGCKHGSGLGTPPAPYWGHLQYHDKAVDVKIHGTIITGYSIADDPKARLICGSGKSDDDGDVDFLVRVKDAGEAGTNDEFDIDLTGAVVYTTFIGAPHMLGSGTGGGGNIRLHKPNNSNTGIFGDCPASENFTLTVNIQSETGGTGTVVSVPPGINCPSDCSESYAAGTEVTLTAQGDAGAAAVFATGDCDSETFGQPPTCIVTMNADRSVTVTFIGQE